MEIEMVHSTVNSTVNITHFTMVGNSCKFLCWNLSSIWPRDGSRECCGQEEFLPTSHQQHRLSFNFTSEQDLVYWETWNTNRSQAYVWCYVQPYKTFLWSLLKCTHAKHLQRL